jgi:LacI family transcriptional regulator
MRKITIEDISRDTGLSRGTVSRALNDRPDISTQTKQRVLDACNRLKYVPSHAARSLATGRNYAVTVLVTDLQSSYTAGILRGVMATATPVHYAIQVIETAADTIAEQFLSPERIDAALNTIPLDYHAATRLRDNLENRVLTSSCPLEGVACDTFAPDFGEAGRMAARLLLRNGLREILFIHMPDRSGAAEQLRGFQDVCRENGINPEDCSATIPNIDSLPHIQARILRAQGIAATTDYIACSAMMTALAGGRKPGEDLAVIGYGNETLADGVYPGLTTVDADGEEIGRRMMESALQRLAHERTENPEHTLIAPRLIQRMTTRQLKME